MRITLHAFGPAAIAALAALYAPWASAQYTPYQGYGSGAYPSTAQAPATSQAPHYTPPSYSAPTYTPPSRQAPTYSVGRYGAAPSQSVSPAAQGSPYPRQTVAAPAARGNQQPAAAYPPANPYTAPPRVAMNADRYSPESTGAAPSYGYGYSPTQPQQQQPPSRYGAYGLPPHLAAAPARSDEQNTQELPDPGEQMSDPAGQAPGSPYEDLLTEAPAAEGEPQDQAEAAPAPAVGADCASETGAYAAAPAHACATTDYGGYFGGLDTECDYGLDCQPRPKRQWFVGVYGLAMERDRPDNVNVAVLVDGAPAGVYYPQPTDQWLGSGDARRDYAGGAEVRFGSTFGSAIAPHGGPAYQPLAWEIAYWGLEEDESSALMVDSFGGTTRMFGRVNYDGLVYDRDGAGGAFAAASVNDFFDYQSPIDSTNTNTVRVLASRVRQTFDAQNVELNFWRFGASSLGIASASPDKRFFMNGMLGIRFLDFDESFQNGAFFTVDDGGGGVAPGEPLAYPGVWPTNDDNVILHTIDVENELVGFQIGCSANCLVTKKWTLFFDGDLGIYGNDASVYQRVSGGGAGVVTFASGGGPAAVRSSKEDVAFLGECRCGMAYRWSDHWRGTFAWRVLAVSGVALANEQIPLSGFANAAEVGYIDSNDSIVLQGLQAGVECKY